MYIPAAMRILMNWQLNKKMGWLLVMAGFASALLPIASAAVQTTLYVSPMGGGMGRATNLPCRGTKLKLKCMRTIFTKPTGKSLTGSSKRHNNRKEKNMRINMQVNGKKYAPITQNVANTRRIPP